MRAILFDLDETLHDRTSSVKNYIQNHYLRQKVESVACEIYCDRFMELDAGGYGNKQKVFQTLVEEFALPISAKEFLEDFRHHAWKNCRAVVNATEVLNELRLRGHKLGIVTNGSIASQNTKLDELGLRPLVDVILISEQEQIKKPHPAIFIRAAEKLKVPVSECAFVGDNPQLDVAGACNVGMKTVWFRGYQAWPSDLTITPDYTVLSLADLLTIEF